MFVIVIHTSVPPSLLEGEDTPGINMSGYPNSSSSKSTKMATKLATKSSFIGIVADISDTITKNTKSFRLVTFSLEDNKTKVFAVNEKFYLRQQSRLVPDATLVVEYETCMKDKTHWVDSDGKEHVHTYDGDNISNIVRATSVQSKMLMLGTLEGKLHAVAESNPNAANAFATLYGNMLR